MRKLALSFVVALAFATVSPAVGAKAPAPSFRCIKNGMQIASAKTKKACTAAGGTWEQAKSEDGKGHDFPIKPDQR
jgi:hypothetical protein